MDRHLKRMATAQRMQQTGLALFHSKGYYNTSVDDVLEELDMSKGAFYYHFKSKEDFFVQIVQTHLAHAMYTKLIAPVQGQDNPLMQIMTCFESALNAAINDQADVGCMLSGFLCEFNGRNENIMEHLRDVLNVWEVHLITSLQKGKASGYLDRHVDTEAVATYVISAYFGIRTLMAGTSRPSTRKYRFMEQLKHYFRTIASKETVL
ncbi:TetR/AcrR family transcriptional regulator [Maribacter sp. 2307ULW6-5]|uniref:TetR/AcrR family transcriptional regulator n=1 Tax=Maribacter sp. 2307ULW6-5 TaxID=3386275 RepID=UPI0039BCE399